MRKNIRRVVDKYYDVYKPDDYEPGMDNLNPKREVEFDLKYEEILSTIKGRIEKQYKLAGLEYGDEEVPLTSEGLSNDIDNLLNFFNKDKNPLIPLAEMKVPIPFLADPSSMATEDLTNHGLTIDCNGIATLDDLADGSGKGVGDEGEDLTGQACNIIYHAMVLKDEVLSESQWDSLGFTNKENPIGCKYEEIIALYDPIQSSGDVQYHFLNWFLDPECTLATGNKLKAHGKREEDGNLAVHIYAKFIADNPEDLTNPIYIQYNSCVAPLNDTIDGKSWINPNDVKYTRGGKTIRDLQGASANGKYFRGWYLDKYAGSAKITKLDDIHIASAVTIDGKKYIQVFAKFTNESEDEDEDIDPQDEEIKKGAFNIDGCDFVELQFLKVILVMVKIVKLLVTIISTVLGIIIPIINIVKEAQLAWINPPFMMSIINQVAQKLMAVMFSLIGVILMKLWSLLNFECISANTISILSQISTTMAGIDDAIASVNSVALVSEEVNKALETRKSLNEMVDNLKQQATEGKELFNSLGDKLKAAIDADGKAANDYFDSLFTNPEALYSESVPPEIRSQVSRAIAEYKKTEKSYTNLVNTVKSWGSSSAKANKVPGAEETTD